MNKLNIKKTYLKFFFFDKVQILSAFFILLVNFSFAQINVVFDAFPQNIQLIQRNDNNEAKVDIIGKVYSENYTEVSLVVQKNNIPFFYARQKINYTTTNSNAQAASFQFTPVIFAELSHYSFKFYAFKNQDSVLVREVNEVLCGENIIVYGQSNALSNDISEIKRFNGENKFGRTTYADYIKDSYLWFPIFSWNYWSAGLIGLEIQKQLIEKYKIPIGIINGSEGNKTIDELSERDESYHENANTIYGRLYRRTMGLEINKNVRIIVWRQGENEALYTEYKNDYDKKFDILRKQFHEDFPAIKKIYTYQNNIYFGKQSLAGDLREYQRTIHEKYDDCEVIATVGTETFDGLHYELEGYQKNGIEASKLIARDFFNSKDTLQINSPNIQSINFTPGRDSLILEFDKNQVLTFPADEKPINPNHPSINIKDYIYLDGINGNVESGKGIGNFIILKLKKPSSAKKITYNPDYYLVEMINVLPGVTQIKNENNVCALTFKNFSINNSDYIVNLTGKLDPNNKKRVLLNWGKLNLSNYIYTIEKAQKSPNNFYEIGFSKDNYYYDYKTKRNTAYFYRIKIQDSSNNSVYSNIIEIPTSITDEFELFNLYLNELIVYPIPVQGGNTLNVSTTFEDPIKSLKVYDMSGKVIDIIVTKNNPYRIETNKLKLGLHIIEAILEDNTKLIKKFVVE